MIRIEDYDEDFDENQDEVESLKKSKKTKKPKKNVFLEALKVVAKLIGKFILYLVNHPILAGLFLAFLFSGTIIGSIHFHWFGINSETTTIESDATLMKIVDLEDLNLFQDKYTGIVTKNDPKDKNEVLYHASYKGTITATCEATKLNIRMDKDKKVIYVTLPEITIETSVDISSIDYMFVESDAENDHVIIETYKMATKDLEKEAKEDTAIIKLAKENLKKTIRGLLAYITNEGYTINFVEE